MQASKIPPPNCNTPSPLIKNSFFAVNKNATLSCIRLNIPIGWNFMIIRAAR